ncbi:MAG: flagellar biosynthetic protein FliO [Planctomycetaceae bacterium]|nr:flagellar biosynthetic protein FliO [Planctomycetaceae bacterium]
MAQNSGGEIGGGGGNTPLTPPGIGDETVTRSGPAGVTSEFGPDARENTRTNETKAADKPAANSGRPYNKFADDQPLNVAPVARAGEEAEASEGFDPVPYIVNMAIGLGVFIVIVIGVIWFLRRSPKIKRYVSGAVEVVSRSYLGSRYSVYVLKVGERLLVVGQGPEGLTTLSEITSPDEVTRFLASVREQQPGSMNNTFRDVLSAASSKPAVKERARPNEEARTNGDARASSSGKAAFIDARVSDDPAPVSASVDAQAKLAAIREHLEKNKARLQ